LAADDHVELISVRKGDGIHALSMAWKVPPEYPPWIHFWEGFRHPPLEEPDIVEDR
jgi:hypothetical protein